MQSDPKPFLPITLTIFFLVVFILIFPGPAIVKADGAVHYLAPAGTDSPDCSNPQNPCRTIQHAIDQATTGDKIYLAAGTYNTLSTVSGHNQIANVTKSLELQGGYSSDFSSRSPETTPTVLDAAYSGRVIYASGAFSLTLDGLRIQHGTATSGGGIYADNGVVLNLNNVQVSECQTTYNFHGAYGSGIYLSAGSLTMSHSLVSDNRYSGSGDISHIGGGLYAYQSNVHLSTSTFRDNSVNEDGGEGNGEGGAIHLQESAAVLQAMTFSGNLATAGNGGGAIFSQAGSFTLSDSVFDHNQAINGGAIHLRTPDSILDGNTFDQNSAQTGGAIVFNYTDAAGSALSHNVFEGNTALTGNGSGGAIYISAYIPLTLEDNQFLQNQAAYNGGAIYAANPTSRTVTSSLEVLQGNTFQGNHANRNGGAIYYFSAVDLLFNQWIDNTAGISGGAIYQEANDHDGGNPVFEGNVLKGNNAVKDGGALYIATRGSDGFINVYRNSAFIENSAGGVGGAVYFYRYSSEPTQFQQLTFSGNTAGDGTTVYLWGGDSVFSNVIFAHADTAIDVRDFTDLAKVLFDAATVTTPYKTNYAPYIHTDQRVEGNAGLEEDQIHLGPASAAIDAGTDLHLTYDVDHEPRLRGNAPDLGADESPYSLSGPSIQASLIAGQPLWKVTYSEFDNPPTTTLEQTYLIPFGNYTPQLTATQYSIQALLPPALALVSTFSQPVMNTNPTGNTVQWTSQSSLDPGEVGWVGMTGSSASISSGTVLSASGHMAYTLSNATSGEIPFSGTTTVPTRPVFPPLLVTPWDGEMCLDDNGQLNATGLASNDVTVRLYENDVLVGSQATDANGKFSITWTTALTGGQAVSIYAKSCESGGTCSAKSDTVTLSYPVGNWCPQRSYWEGDVDGVHYVFRFRNEGGNYSTNGFVLPGVYGFWNTKLHLYSCCQSETNPFHVITDAANYQTPTGHTGRMWTFDIATAHDVTIRSSCSGFVIGDVIETSGEILIDPDGFVFDQAEGGSYSPVTGMFTPAEPLAGYTVTAYEWVEEWGTWIRWPAELYEGQVNPQVTGENGYYAFFTPPGKFYLQATGDETYQSWRSPVIEVVSELVHMNSPLTAWDDAGPVVTLTSAPDGLSETQVTIPVNGSLTWVASMTDDATADQWAEMTATPLIRLLSALDPLLNPNGWDSGMLAPGGSYTRRFTAPGVYPYSDGYGHTGQIIVSGDTTVYIPLVRR